MQTLNVISNLPQLAATAPPMGDGGKWKPMGRSAWSLPPWISHKTAEVVYENMLSAIMD
jgi:hypothetical protein